ncbi:MAG: flagellar biosynthesis anti-sigma factor FlgM [Candidatus Hydrogenedentes bacterium]|nr:flagellar biosynthesis anti-sigma factor FlgM [Candidatus Hydrogenedentota bacterium]
MVGIQGLGGPPEPKSGGPAKVRGDRDTATTATPTSGGATPASPGEDKIRISSEAQAAAEVSRLVQASVVQSDIRSERVEAARARLEQGSYKDPAVVSQVADKILKYLG